MDGHTIDHADTPEEKINFYSGCLSTNIRETHLPEPKNSYWGKHIRNPLVRNIRKLKGMYSQLSYYGENIERTDESNTAIPRGVLFFEHNPTGELVNGWDISWNDQIHEIKNLSRNKTPRNKLRNHQCKLASQHREKIRTLAYTYPKVDETMAPCQKSISNLDNPLDRLTLYRMSILADSEATANYSSMLYLNGIQTVGNQARTLFKPETIYWGARSLEYMRGLDEYDADWFIGNLDIAKRVQKVLNQNEVFDPTHENYDNWHQMLSNQEDSGHSREYIQMPAIVHEPLTWEIVLPYGKGSATQSVQLSSSEFSRPRKITVVDQDEGSKRWQTRRARYFLETNMTILKKHREKIIGDVIDFEPARLNNDKKVRDMIDHDIFGREE